jgi:flagellar biosynthetic protein FlhB
MAETDKESKTEEPTERRIQEAVESGNVPFSRELPTLLSLVAIVLAGSFLFSGGAVQLGQALSRFIDAPGDWPVENAADAILILRWLGYEAGKLLLPVVGLLVVAGVAGSLLQNPPQLAGKRIQPQWSRISLIAGWRRVFGAAGLMEFLKGVLKLGAVGLVGYMAMQATQAEVVNAMFMDPVTLPGLIRGILVRIFWWVALLTLALVAIDLVWSRIHWRRELRMSREELKQEMKDSEGNPLVKSRMRSIAKSRARQRMMTAVPRATLVIANPKHYAVALRYVREEGGAPRVLAKGADLVALQIRRIAEERGIPVIEDKPLARSLYETVEIDQLIPPAFYKAVAEIIHYLHVRRAGTPRR